MAQARAAYSPKALAESRPRFVFSISYCNFRVNFVSKDVPIVFDIRRYQDDVVRFANEAAAQGADILLFTDQWLSPIAAAARHVFALRTATPAS